MLVLTVERGNKTRQLIAECKFGTAAYSTNLF